MSLYRAPWLATNVLSLLVRPMTTRSQYPGLPSPPQVEIQERRQANSAHQYPSGMGFAPEPEGVEYPVDSHYFHRTVAQGDPLTQR